MAIFNRYKNHHKVLHLLNDKYFKYKKGNIDLYSITLEDIAKEINENEIETEKILTELEEFKCVNSKDINNSYKILDGNGIKKYKSKYFLEKQKEYFISNLKSFLGIIVSFLAIASFVITVWTMRINNKEQTNRIKEIEKRITQIELQENDIQKIPKSVPLQMIDTLK